MISARLIHKEFRYTRPATTSRGTYRSKEVRYIVLADSDKPGVSGIGECSLFPGLSFDDTDDFDAKLKLLIRSINDPGSVEEIDIDRWPSIQFGLETAKIDLASGGKRVLYPSEFTEGTGSIITNGLIWMGPEAEIKSQVKAKLQQGFRCLKMKIGSIGIKQELEILRQLRKDFSAQDLELRVDANGAFSVHNIMPVLDELSRLKVHSIEQPIPAGHLEEMAGICRESPIPIALDEELIGIREDIQKVKLLEGVRPHYIILKPGLLGGTTAAKTWKHLADERGIGYWITSSLETNIGLNAIAQWAYTQGIDMPQGLSTGSLFSNNIPSPLHLCGERLHYDPEIAWDLEELLTEIL